ncbi:hypothetical protein [Streptomyces violaceusniger]|uniref:Uncharacterized protein n=1 Tax=Streptomyces violaceusniger (strain Tu 4113) TaxID=653045 RepID=G2PHJ3_STRV4|nr:hypothetical protein [Streptomyces violaceusniger]AEM88996.1 hypothetical protein Strvi_0223 [Streptomyces violaceusniger Tu 4113]
MTGTLNGCILVSNVGLLEGTRMGAQQGDSQGEQRIVVVVRNETAEQSKSGPTAARLEWWFIPGLLLFATIVSLLR